MIMLLIIQSINMKQYILEHNPNEVEEIFLLAPDGTKILTFIASKIVEDEENNEIVIVDTMDEQVPKAVLNMDVIDYKPPMPNHPTAF